MATQRAPRTGRHQRQIQVLIGTLLCALEVACTTPAPKKTTGPDPALLPPGDTAYELARDRDLEMLRATFATVAVDDAGRATLRRRLADEYARRIDWNLDHERRQAAFDALIGLAGLWHPHELWTEHPGAGLSAYADEIERIRVVFSRSGGDIEATTALVMLLAAEPKRAAWCKQEIAMIFDYANELSVAAHGSGAERSRPIAILESVVLAFPSPFAVRTLSNLYVARQAALTKRFSQSGVDVALIRAHGRGALHTSWNLVRIHALALQFAEARKPALKAVGFGTDPDIVALLDAALAETATDQSWLALASIFQGEPGQEAPSDWVAALRTAEAAARKFPRSADAHAAAATAARQTGNAQLSIAHLEHALKLAPDRRVVAEKLAELYQFRVSQLAFAERPHAAEEVLARWVALDESAHRKWPEEPITPGLAEAYASMGGALVSLGDIDEATQYLERSLAIEPTLAALESLGTVALKHGRAQQAITHFERALTLPVDEVLAHFDRNRVLRLCGEAYILAGNTSKARTYFTAALDNWLKLRKRAPGMPGSYLAETWLESGKLSWHLADKDGALNAFAEAVDANPEGASVHAEIVAFLVIRGQYDRALEVYHAALSSHGVSDYFKVYMSLWLIAEARRQDRPPDPLAKAYLASREGRLWHDALARYASGRADLPQLQAEAKSRGQRAELLYYRAVLTEAGENPQKAKKLLERVLRTDMVLFFEYEMAKHWLDRGDF